MIGCGYYIASLADHDVAEQAAWLLANVSEAKMMRFLRNVLATASMLASMPYLGRRVAEGVELRTFPVRGFLGIRLVYRPTANGIEVLRVVQVNQHWTL